MNDPGPYEHVIRELQEEIRRLQYAIDVLKQRAPGDRRGTFHEKTIATVHMAGVKGPARAFSDLTNEEAVDDVLRTAGEPVTIQQIIDQASARGKELNPNSVRWVLGKGVKDSKYRKSSDKESRAKLYALRDGG